MKHTGPKEIRQYKGLERDVLLGILDFPRFFNFFITNVFSINLREIDSN